MRIGFWGKRNPRPTPSLARDERGSTAVNVAIAAAVVLGVGGLTLDLGRLVTLNTEMQNYADAAALPTQKPVLIAGGVGPDNVRVVIEQARPWGVDVCSRVERVAGVKDPLLLERLFQEIADVQAPSPAGS